MNTAACRMFGLDAPIFAFSHCRDVVVEVSRAGGMGILGASGFDREHLAEELRWIDAHVGGKPYGVDLLMPNRAEEVGAQQRRSLDELLPAGHRAFLDRLMSEAGVPPLPEHLRAQLMDDYTAKVNMTTADAEALVDVALEFPVRLVVSALGVAPEHMIARIHSHGVKVGAMVGKVEHALQQKAAGIDLLIAQGSEAGGHTGSVSSLVLWPQVVDAVAPLPVLAAGGVGRGSQMAAALALGCDGVWCGSIWLGTAESELLPETKQRFFSARSEDAVQTRALTGKPCRALRSDFTEAWAKPGAPTTLPMPLQTLLVAETKMRIERARDARFLTYPVGQVVGDMREEAGCRQVVQGMLAEFADACERLQGVVAE